MFNQLFQGSSPWALAALELGLAIHIGSGLVAILSGAGALVAGKGGRMHRRFGTVFVAAMVTMSLAASTLALVAVERGHLGQVANVFAGPFAFYLVTTGWLAVRRPQGVIGRAEICGCAGVLVIAAVALFGLLPSTLGPQGEAQGVPVAAPLILAGVAALLAALDIRVIRKGGLTGASRIQRHLWRMCLGLFFATGSFFIGQQQDMPTAVRGSPVLLMLGLFPLFAMVFWLAQTRWKARRRPSAALA